MTERPILFSGPMVRAILDGRKTQTRRIMRPQPEGDPAKRWPDPNRWQWPCSKARTMLSLGEAPCSCPFGYKGDLLWVRETWCFANPEYPFVGSERPVSQRGDRCYYRATDGELERDDGGSPWRPSIHMPRWASRITLRVTDVRVQRLLEISEEDAKAEGCRDFFEEFPQIGRDQRLTCGALACDAPYRAGFAVMWDNISRATWESNPWVWAISFKRLP